MREKWCRDHQTWTIYWKDVIWSDESSFTLFSYKRQDIRIENLNKPYVADYLLPTIKHGVGFCYDFGGNIVVLSLFSHSRHCPNYCEWRAQWWSSYYQNIIKYFPRPVQSPDFNIIKPLWEVLDQITRSRFPSPALLKLLVNVLVQERVNITFELFIHFTNPFLEELQLFYKQIGIQHLIN